MFFYRKTVGSFHCTYEWYNIQCSLYRDGENLFTFSGSLQCLQPGQICVYIQRTLRSVERTAVHRQAQTHCIEHSLFLVLCPTHLVVYRSICYNLQQQQQYRKRPRLGYPYVTQRIAKPYITKREHECPIAIFNA